nr:MAG TPA: hypothetical protein [Caudoviricetes sp.]
MDKKCAKFFKKCPFFCKIDVRQIFWQIALSSASNGRFR